MIGSFSFNGVDSSSFKLVCKSVKRPLLPAAKVKRVELAGSSGAYDFDGLEYSLRTVTMKIQYIGTSYEELRSRARSIAAWLSVGTWSRLIINDESDKYYLAKVTGEVDLEGLWESGSADVVFDCQPFAYSVTESTYNFNATGAMTYEFQNGGTREIDYRSPQGSKFKITAVGTLTTLSLALNGETLNFTEAVNGTLVIDNFAMTATVGGVNKFDKLTGDIDTFLSIIPGTNSLVIGGSGLNLAVTIEFIPLWI